MRQRRFGSVVRLMVTQDMPAHILEILMNNLELDASEVYRVRGPLSLKRLMDLYQLDRPESEGRPVRARRSASRWCRADRGRRYFRADPPPEHSAAPSVRFLPAGGRILDRRRRTIRPCWPSRSCLYRVGRNSPVVEALARRDRRRQAGGRAGGTESAVRRREQHRMGAGAGTRGRARRLRPGGPEDPLARSRWWCGARATRCARYVHLATGNYNAVTAHLYTDIGMFTCDEDIADDVTNLFNYLTGYSAKTDYQEAAGGAA